MKNYNVLDIAKYFVNSGILLSHKKLQKLVYYAYSWSLVKNNKSGNNLNNRLFNSRIEAWVHGPVCPELYYAYNNNKISMYDGKKIDIDTKKILDLIIQIYGKYTGEDLERLTHNEDPWIIARKGYSQYERSSKEVQDTDIYNYYSNRIA